MFSFFKSKIKSITNFIKKFSIGKKIKALFSQEINDKLFDEFEKLLYESDLGIKISSDLTLKLKDIFKKNNNLKIDEIIKIIKNELLKDTIPFQEAPLKNPHIIMIVGVNGSGKTTSIAKLAKFYKDMGKKVLLIAADTYRAAAIEQLEIWANKIDVDIVKSKQGLDPASVIFDGLNAAKSRDVDVVIIDTAGRLHTKTNLMQELEKIKRVTKKIIEDAPHETILVVDATTGQNAVSQAKTFNEYTPLSSIFLTKLDGSAKGGIVIAIQNEIKVPIKWIGIGEKIEDIEPFDINKFLDDLLSLD
jgi:fused signal recognition particle receptor